MAFKDRLREAIEARHLTQAEAAHKSGISQSYLSRLLNGTSIPAVDVAVPLAKALNVSMDWLCEVGQVGDLSADEVQLLGEYRQLDEGGRYYVRVMIGQLMEYITTHPPLAEVFRRQMTSGTKGIRRAEDKGPDLTGHAPLDKIAS